MKPQHFPFAKEDHLPNLHYAQNVHSSWGLVGRLCRMFRAVLAKFRFRLQFMVFQQKQTSENSALKRYTTPAEN